MIVIIDYGMGNLRSVEKAFKRIGIKPSISSERKVIEKARKLILPGVGNYANGIVNLKQYGILNILNKKVLKDKIPVLGICLGMQLFTDWGEEGNVAGLGWIKGKTTRFKFNEEYKIPHMGWNTIIKQKSNSLLNKLKNDSSFYFVHSYHVECEDKKDILATTNYGTNFISMIQKNNIYGTQFHPEKSHSTGLQLLKNFIDI